MLAFEQQLHKLGWSEGQNLQTEYRWNGGDINLIVFLQVSDPVAHRELAGVAATSAGC